MCHVNYFFEFLDPFHIWFIYEARTSNLARLMLIARSTNEKKMQSHVNGGWEVVM